MATLRYFRVIVGSSMPMKNLENDAAAKADALLVFDTLRRMLARAGGAGHVEAATCYRNALEILARSPVIRATLLDAGQEILDALEQRTRAGELPELSHLLAHTETALEHCQCRPRRRGYRCLVRNAWVCDRCHRIIRTENDTLARSGI